MHISSTFQEMIFSRGGRAKVRRRWKDGSCFRRLGLQRQCPGERRPYMYRVWETRKRDSLLHTHAHTHLTPMHTYKLHSADASNRGSFLCKAPAMYHLCLQEQVLCQQPLKEDTLCYPERKPGVNCSQWQTLCTQSIEALLPLYLTGDLFSLYSLLT